MFDQLLESSHRDDSNKRLNIGYCEEIKHEKSYKCDLNHLIWCSGI